MGQVHFILQKHFHPFGGLKAVKNEHNFATKKEIRIVLKRKKEIIMKRIAHRKVECKHRGKWTGAFVAKDGASSTEVKCKYCKKTFTFESGMIYNPIGYMPEIPSWAMIK